MTISDDSTSGKKIHKAGVVWERYKAWKTSAKYLVFLMSLETLTWKPSFYGERVALRGQIDWDDLFVIITLIAGIQAAGPKKAVRIIAYCFAVLTLGLTWTAELVGTQMWTITGDACFAVFFGFVAFMILYDIWTTTGVSADTIIGSACVYILIGATWAFFYSLTELLVPNSFNLTAAAAADSGKLFVDHQDYPLLMYYSFVTLCSLGYGDIIPISPAARMLTTAEAIVGQFYLAIFVARLISMYIPRKQRAITEDQGLTASPDRE